MIDEEKFQESVHRITNTALVSLVVLACLGSYWPEQIWIAASLALIVTLITGYLVFWRLPNRLQDEALVDEEDKELVVEGEAASGLIDLRQFMAEGEGAETLIAIPNANGDIVYVFPNKADSIDNALLFPFKINEEAERALRWSTMFERLDNERANKVSNEPLPDNRRQFQP